MGADAELQARLRDSAAEIDRCAAVGFERSGRCIARLDTAKDSVVARQEVRRGQCTSDRHRNAQAGAQRLSARLDHHEGRRRSVERHGCGATCVCWPEAIARARVWVQPGHCVGVSIEGDSWKLLLPADALNSLFGRWRHSRVVVGRDELGDTHRGRRRCRCPGGDVDGATAE